MVVEEADALGMLYRQIGDLQSYSALMAEQPLLS